MKEIFLTSTCDVLLACGLDMFKLPFYRVKLTENKNYY